MSAESDAWLASHDRMERATEITLPVFERVGPVYSFSPARGGGWYVCLFTRPCPSHAPIAECDHHHLSEDEAWQCARELAEALVAEALTTGF